MDTNLFLVTNLPILIKLTVAIVLGGIIGIERTHANKNAGLRTYAIVSLGACLFTLISIMSANDFKQFGINPMYIVAAIVTGLGFLCGGVIIYHENKLIGLTTAAGMWVAAGVGISVAFGYYVVAAMAAILTIIIFSTIVWDMEEKFRQDSDNSGH